MDQVSLDKLKADLEQMAQDPNVPESVKAVMSDLSDIEHGQEDRIQAAQIALAKAQEAIAQLMPAPAPDPVPVPVDPAPTPDPIPAPDPIPPVEPGPEPTPDPVPPVEPTPDPTPDPAPPVDPVPPVEPTPDPQPDPVPAPTPDPVPVEKAQWPSDEEILAAAQDAQSEAAEKEKVLAVYELKKQGK